ncbi:hypothetical protein MRX96_053798 [Rhipicephalus microplus]
MPSDKPITRLRHRHRAACVGPSDKEVFGADTLEVVAGRGDALVMNGSWSRRLSRIPPPSLCAEGAKCSSLEGSLAESAGKHACLVRLESDFCFKAHRDP